MRSEEIDQMRKLPLFQDVEQERVNEMLRVSFLQRFPAGVELVQEGEPADFLHAVVDGNVEIYSSYRERETTICVLGEGQWFITAAVILDRVYLKSARSLTPARVLLIPAQSVRSAFEADPAFARCIANDLAASYRMVIKDIKNQKLRSGIERLANWIIAYDAQLGQPRKFDLPFEKKVLASRLGMAPEVLSRTLATLSAYDVKISGPTIEIQDIKALRKLARPINTIDDPQV